MSDNKKNHVGRPTNEEVKQRKIKKKLVFLVPIIIVIIVVTAILNTKPSKAVGKAFIDNSNKKYKKMGTIFVDKRYYIQLFSKMTAVQGITTFDNYYMYTRSYPNDVEQKNTALVLASKDSPQNITKVFTNKAYGHANDITYNTSNKNIYVATAMGNTIIEIKKSDIYNSSKKYRIIKLPKKVSSIAYDKVYNRYYAGKGSNIYMFKSNFKLSKTMKKLYTWTPQGIETTLRRVLVINYKKVKKNNKTVFLNRIDVYNKSLSYVGTYEVIADGELESISVDSNKLILLINRLGNDYDYIYQTNIPANML